MAKAFQNAGASGTARRPVVVAISLCALITLWWACALGMADPTVLPSPVEVMKVTVAEASAGDLWHHMSATLLRVAAAFTCAMLFGTVIGIALGLMPRLNQWADPWVVVFLNLPALVVIVLAYLWLGLNEFAAILAVSVNKTAMVIVTIREGVLARDRAIAEMAQVFRMSLWKRLRHVIWPQLAPYVSASVRNGMAMIWKIVLVVEFLGRGNGVGFQIHLYFQLFETAHVMAYSLSFVAVMLLIEYLLVQTGETRARRWRGAEVK
ncbi:ABC transporter permease [Shimia sp. R9_1]|uniref:ABC transporter permease n=1 Tax=Shimia sp. R9_1 TaxID=2821111 RepID=UPI001ADA33ED|nr:ABC transporter permease [Shimia sp. R9_1]MBO9406685.1 ABC transporter permease [Shimia sp. R9_1]